MASSIVRADLAARQEQIGLAELRRMVADRPPALDTETALRGPSADAVQVIAEVKGSDAFEAQRPFPVRVVPAELSKRRGEE